jgi:hypothetical protein
MSLNKILAGLVLIISFVPLICCSRREPLEVSDAEVRVIGEPIRYSLSADFYEDDNACTFGVRLADFAWEGLVKNFGHRAADSVYVRIRFAGGFTDSVFIQDCRLNPNETGHYRLYCLSAQCLRIDYVDVLWRDLSGLSD